jgi:hypothetical protein
MRGTDLNDKPIIPPECTNKATIIEFVDKNEIAVPAGGNAIMSRFPSHSHCRHKRAGTALEALHLRQNLQLMFC